ncbi:FAD-dependent oxidoreductase [Roseomonas sp. NAR14]|uniref:FAD-dependent oxidoreductase n=1 Tax=Roseomonas acroporae TaxID=2937791 RepID=A0A9X1Y9N6_9PROT|nr:FAD-dependent oxidoreductase [Roseomonas acroporae]MCK8784682.1 FAD-dependent oxidoreductase [Roseomonas acroporae]
MADYDVVILGAGTAGHSVAALAAALGLRVALVADGAAPESRIALPALAAAARRAALLRDARRFGLGAPAPTVEWDGVRAHVRGAVAALAPDHAPARFRAMGIEVIEGRGYFAAPDAVEAGGRRLRFRRCLLAGGGVPALPHLPGLDSVPCLTEATIHDLAVPPAHLLVLGGGEAAPGLAQAHARLGCRVTLVEPDGLAAGHEPELADGLRRALRRDGVSLREGVAPAWARATGTGVMLGLEGGEALEGSHLLAAGARAPALAGLDLAAAGIEATPRGIATDRGLRALGNRRVWAAGPLADAGDGQGGEAAEAAQVMTLARGMLFHLPARFDPATVPRLLGTDPMLAQVGLTEAAARAAGHDGLRLLRWPLAETDRAVAENGGAENGGAESGGAGGGAAGGLVKLVATPKGRLLGAGLLAPEAGEMAGLFAALLGRRLPLGALAGLALPWPVFTEAARRAAGEFYAPRLLSPLSRRLVGLLRYLP